MTLFISRKNVTYEVSEVYVMAFTFLLSYAVCRIAKAVIAKQINKKNKKKKLTILRNPKGGAQGLELSDNSELALAILSCISDNERYLVKDPIIREIIFNLVKAKIKNESLILTLNMMRFLALRFINNDQTIIVKVRNLILSSRNRVRLLTRVSLSASAGIIAVLASSFAYGLLILLLFFDSTQHCAFKCEDYFDRLPPDEVSVRVYSKEPAGQLVIASNDDARQVDIYTPAKISDPEVLSATNEVQQKITHRKSRIKAKQVKFSDFRRIDPVLSAFENLEEPIVPQKVCPFSEEGLKEDIF